MVNRSVGPGEPTLEGSGGGEPTQNDQRPPGERVPDDVVREIDRQVPERDIGPGQIEPVGDRQYALRDPVAGGLRRERAAADIDKQVPGRDIGGGDIEATEGLGRFELRGPVERDLAAEQIDQQVSGPEVGAGDIARRGDSDQFRLTQTATNELVTQQFARRTGFERGSDFTVQPDPGLVQTRGEGGPGVDIEPRAEVDLTAQGRARATAREVLSEGGFQADGEFVEVSKQNRLEFDDGGQLAGVSGDPDRPDPLLQSEGRPPGIAEGQPDQGEPVPEAVPEVDFVDPAGEPPGADSDSASGTQSRTRTDLGVGGPDASGPVGPDPIDAAQSAELGDAAVDTAKDLYGGYVGTSTDLYAGSLDVADAATDFSAATEEALYDVTGADQVAGRVTGAAGTVVTAADDAIGDPIRTGARRAEDKAQGLTETGTDAAAALSEGRPRGTLPLVGLETGESASEPAQTATEAVGSGAVQGVTAGPQLTAGFVGRPDAAGDNVKQASDDAVQGAVENVVRPLAEDTTLVGTFGPGRTVETSSETGERVALGAGTGLAGTTLGAPGDLIRLSDAAVGATETTGSNVAQEGTITEGLETSTAQAASVTLSGADEAASTAAENPLFAAGVVAGGSAGLATQSSTLGIGVPRAIRKARRRLRGIGSQELDESELVQEGVRTGEKPFPAPLDKAKYASDPAKQFRTQAGEFTPDEIQARIESAVDADPEEFSIGFKALSEEPAGPGRGRSAQGFRSASRETGLDSEDIEIEDLLEDYDETGFDYEAPGSFFSTELSPHFLRIDPGEQFSFRPGLPRLGDDPTAVAAAARVREADADTSLEFAREMAEREGEPTLFTKPEGYVNPREIEAVLPPGAELVDLDGGPLRNTLRRFGIGSDFTVDVGGEPVPIRPTASQNLFGDDSGAPNTSVVDRVSPSSSRPSELSLQTRVDRPAPPVAAPGSAAPSSGLDSSVESSFGTLDGSFAAGSPSTGLRREGTESEFESTVVAESDAASSSRGSESGSGFESTVSRSGGSSLSRGFDSALSSSSGSGSGRTVSSGGGSSSGGSSGGSPFGGSSSGGSSGGSSPGGSSGGSPFGGSSGGGSGGGSSFGGSSGGSSFGGSSGGGSGGGSSGGGGGGSSGGGGGGGGGGGSSGGFFFDDSSDGGGGTPRLSDPDDDDDAPLLSPDTGGGESPFENPVKTPSEVLSGRANPGGQTGETDDGGLLSSPDFGGERL